MKEGPVDIDECLERRKPEVRQRLESLLQSIRAACPEASGELRPGRDIEFKLGRRVLVQFHEDCERIYLRFDRETHTEFREQLSGCVATSKSLQIPAGQPLPLETIARMVIFQARRLALKR